MNLPPQPVEANLDLRIAQGLENIRSHAGFSAFLSYARPGGSADEREVACPIPAPVRWEALDLDGRLSLRELLRARAVPDFDCGRRGALR